MDGGTLIGGIVSMKVFKDNAGRSWSVCINVDAIRRVRSLLNVNLLEIVEGKLVERLIADPVLLCDVLYAVVKLDADAQKISDLDFGRAMAGDAIEHATTALLEELVDFFPLRQRQVLSLALQKLKALQDRVMDLAKERLNDPAIDRQLEDALKNIGASFGNSPASSASTPAL
jgi:hypothetical protein